jgi:competence protein ComEA
MYSFAKKMAFGLTTLLASMSIALAAVNLNTATKAELEGIKGVGPAKAQAIIDHREKTPFKSVEDLKNVKGFGAKSVDKLKSDLVVDGAPAAAANPAASPAVNATTNHIANKVPAPGSAAKPAVESTGATTKDAKAVETKPAAKVDAKTPEVKK